MKAYGLMPWLLAAAVLVHLTLALVFPEHKWVTSASWSVLYALAFIHLRRFAALASPKMQWRWHAFGAYMLCAFLGFSAILYAELTEGLLNLNVGWFNNMLRAWRALPLLLVLCTLEDYESDVTRLLDAIQLILIGSVFVVIFTPDSFFPGADTALLKPSLFNLYMDWQSWVVAALAALAAWTSKDDESAFLHRSIAVFLLLAVPLGILTNRYLINSTHIPSGSWLYVFNDLPITALVFLTAGETSSHLRLKGGQAIALLRLIASGILCMLVIAASLLAALPGRHPYFGCAIAITSLLLYSLRSALLQLRLQSVHGQLQRANQQLEDSAQRDSLTGLHNRRWFDTSLLRDWKDAARSKQPISLLVVDVDHFKKLNDAVGHAGGDDCLRAISRLLREHLPRDTDSVARYGGEEFVCLLPHTSCEGALTVAERLLEAVRASGLTNPGSPMHRLTVSIGGSTHRPSVTGADPLSLFLEADRALYQAKNAGRNCVRFAPSPDSSLSTEEW